jgi:hypothetical protein
VIRDFRFRVQRVIVDRKRRFQLRVGMYGERDLEFIPVHRTAYAQWLPLQESHSTEAEAEREKDVLMEWLRTGERSAPMRLQG